MIDFGGDIEVFVGDGAIGDPGIDQCHLKVLVTQQGGDGFESHPPVDRLGGEGMAQLVRVDMTDPGTVGDTANHPGKPVPIHRRHLVGEEPTRPSNMVGVVGLPFGDELNEFGMQRDIAVVAEFPDRDMEPVVLTDLDDRIG